ncbi:DMT family transporter [Neisseria sp. Ec49-e6-T10]|uniref:DMT family transporter n=1 Tax=Neisseria sp. Ec49-e6-T10 TaxID=3140744 RepID=UPI003EBBA261
MSTAKSAYIGFWLAIVTAVMWGVVPIAIKRVLPVMDPFTLSWYRFMISAIGLFLILKSKHQMPDMQLFKNQKFLIALAVATVGLGGNFLFFSSALQYLTPTVSQVIGQISVVLLMLFSTFVFKESLQRSQIIGMVILISGLLLFFNRQLIEIFTRLTDYSFGVFLGVCGSTIWVAYGLMQKILLRKLKSQQILWLLYCLCTLFLLPIASPAQILNLSWGQLLLLLFCGVNTLIAYGALAEAMNRWKVAQVSAIVTLTPLFTLLFSDIFALLWPNTFDFPALNFLGYLGALVVVAGAMFAAAGKQVIEFYQKKRMGSWANKC